MPARLLRLLLLLGVAPAVRAGAPALAVSRLGVNGLFRAGDLAAAAFPTNESLLLSWDVETTTAGSHTSDRDSVGFAGFEVTVTPTFVPPGAFASPRAFAGLSATWSSGVVAAPNQPFFRLPDAFTATLAQGAAYEWTVQLFCDSTAAVTPATAAAPTPCSGAVSGAFDTAPADDVWAGAMWIGGGSELRADWAFPATTGPLVHARAYVTGVGAFDLHVDGAPASDHVMPPGESVYDVKTLYVTYNLTQVLAAATSTVAIGARLGNSKWGYLDIYANRSAAGDQSGDSTRALRMVAVAHFADGTVSTLRTTADGSPSSWVVRHGPVVYDHLWHGEIYDRRQELGAPEQAAAAGQPRAPAWDAAPLATYPAGSWRPASVMQPLVHALYPALQPPIRPVARFSPVAAPVRYGNSMLLDFGENMAGVTEVTVDTEGLLAAFAADAGGDSATARAVAANRTLVLRLEHTEIVGPDGHAFNDYFPGMEFNHSATCNMSDWYERKWYECANQTDAFVFSPGAAAPLRYTATFTYHGFRHLQVTPLEILGGPTDNTWVALSSTDAAAVLASVSAVALKTNSDLEPAGALSFGATVGGHGDPGAGTDDVLSLIFNATLRSHTSNLWSIPTDCPQREKRGWMADGGISSSSLMYFRDSLAFHTNFLQLIADNQAKGCPDQPSTSIYGPCQAPETTNMSAAAWFNGSVPDVTPFATGPYGSNPGTTDWQFAYVMVARALGLHYGPLAVPALQRLWPSLVLFMTYIDRLVDPATGLLLAGARGDWVPPPSQVFAVSPQEVAAFTHTLCLGYMSEIANVTGQPAAAAAFAARFQRNSAAYHAHFYNNLTDASDPAPPARCCYGSGAQASNLFALHLGAVPSSLLNDTAAALTGAIRAAPNGSTTTDGPHMDVGIFGTTYIFDVLAALGHSDLGLDLLRQTTQPSLGYMVASDATTLWEAWTGNATYQVSSRNHIMFGGGVNRFLMRAVGGLWINEAPGAATSAAGWRRVQVGPSAAALRSLSHSAVSHRSPFGVHSVAWRTASTAATAATSAACAGSAYTLNATVPVGVEATVTLPLHTAVPRPGAGLPTAARVSVRDARGTVLGSFSCGTHGVGAGTPGVLVAVRAAAVSCAWLPGQAGAAVVWEGVRGSGETLSFHVAQACA